MKRLVVLVLVPQPLASTLVHQRERILVDLLVADGVETVTMIVAVEVDTAMNHMVVDAMVAETTETEVTAAVIVTTTTTLPVELIVTPDPAMVVTVTAALVMTAAEVEEDTKTVIVDTTEVVVMIDQLETRLPLLPMVIKLLVEMLESHMEVEPTMMTDIPVVNIDC